MIEYIIVPVFIVIGYKTYTRFINTKWNVNIWLGGIVENKLQFKGKRLSRLKEISKPQTKKNGSKTYLYGTLYQTEQGRYVIVIESHRKGLNNKKYTDKCSTYYLYRNEEELYSELNLTYYRPLPERILNKFVLRASLLIQRRKGFEDLYSEAKNRIIERKENGKGMIIKIE